MMDVVADREATAFTYCFLIERFTWPVVYMMAELYKKVPCRLLGLVA